MKSKILTLLIIFGLSQTAFGKANENMSGNNTNNQITNNQITNNQITDNKPACNGQPQKITLVSITTTIAAKADGRSSKSNKGTH